MKTNKLDFSAFSDENKVVALMQHLGIEFNYDDSDNICGDQDNLDEIEESSYDDSIFEYGSQEYVVYTDSEADDAFDEYLECYIDECVLCDIPQAYRKYFDSEKFKDDCLQHDGRGHSLSGYDGSEKEESVDGITYFICRKN